MCNWRRWVWPGILTTAILTALAMFFHSTTIEKDLRAKAGSALQADHPWASVALDGRDLTLNGMAPDEESAAAALKMADDAYDVRVAKDMTTLPPVASPFIFKGVKDDAGVTLTGNVPTEAVRAEIVAQAEKAMPGIAVKDEMTIARGAPEGFTALTGFGLMQLSNLVSGEVSLSDADYSVSGAAADSAAYEAETANANNALPQGGKLAAANIVAPAVKPYTFSASKGDDGTIILQGYAPSLEARDAMVAAAEAVPGAKVVNRLQIASGAPDGFADAAKYAIGFLPQFDTGAAKLTDAEMSVEGRAANGDSFNAAAAAEGTVPAGFNLKAQVVLPRADPFVWKAQRGSEIVLEGVVPSQDVADAIKSQAQSYFGTDAKLTDKQTLASGEPRGFASAASVALSAISRLEGGAAEISGTDLRVTGEALSQPAKVDIERKVKNGVPPGFNGVADISVKPAPLEPGGLGMLAPNLCQLTLNDTLKIGINFQTAKADIAEDSFGVLDRLAYTVRQCPGTRVEIAGHTDSDGAEDYNQKLSQARAEAVRQFLGNSGVDTQWLTAVGYGETRPIASNDTDEGKARNRRIEFIITQ